MIKRSLLLLTLLQPISCKTDNNEIIGYGTYKETCLVEGVSDTTKAEPNVRKEVMKDSLVFITQNIMNCCGGRENFVLSVVNDTLRPVNSKANDSEEKSLCDCNCLFEIRVAINKRTYDSLSLPVYDGNRQLN